MKVPDNLKIDGFLLDSKDIENIELRKSILDNVFEKAQTEIVKIKEEEFKKFTVNEEDLDKSFQKRQQLEFMYMRYNDWYGNIVYSVMLFLLIFTMNVFVPIDTFIIFIDVMTSITVVIFTNKGIKGHAIKKKIKKNIFGN